jgi:hypothetical protein
VFRVEMVNGIDEIARNDPSKRLTAAGRRFEEPANEHARRGFWQARHSVHRGQR